MEYFVIFSLTMYSLIRARQLTLVSNVSEYDAARYVSNPNVISTSNSMRRRHEGGTPPSLVLSTA